MLFWDERWDIFCFSGHSESQDNGQTGFLYINSQDKLAIEELKNALRASRDRGLQLVIFNSCDGLGYDNISIGLAAGLLAGLAGGQRSGVVLIQHFVLRVILWYKGYIPWNYARFLDYATERIFLQKTGGSYTFIHRRILEYFASLRSS